MRAAGVTASPSPLGEKERVEKNKTETENRNEMNRCGACKADIPKSTGRGRPRKYCVECVPPGTGADAIRAWRKVNSDRVAAYNESRRVVPMFIRYGGKQYSR